MTLAKIMGIELFKVSTMDGKPVVAHPKNECDLILTAKGFEGKPMSNVELKINIGTTDFPFTSGKIIGAADNGTFTGKTDANGCLTFHYEPPEVDKARYPFLSEVRHQKRPPIAAYFGIVGQKTAGAAKVDLDWPHPKITKFSGADGTDAGLWTKPSHPVQVRIEDIDSTQFTYTVKGVGDFRLVSAKSPILNAEAEWSRPAELNFLYRPPKMGLNVTALPNLKAQIMEANLKFALSYVDSLLKIPGMDKVISKGGYYGSRYQQKSN